MLARRIASLIALVLSVGTGRASAQDSSIASHPWILGVGVNANTLPYATPSFQFGREWRDPASRFGVRLTGDISSSENSHPYYPGFYSDGSAGTSRTHTNDRTFGMAATYALTRGRIQPYLLSGFIVQFGDVATHYEPNPTAPPLASGSLNTAYDYHFPGGGVGMQGGLGVQAGLGGATLFMEARALMPTGNRGPATVTPLTIGFRF